MRNFRRICIRHTRRIFIKVPIYAVIKKAVKVYVKSKRDVAL